MTGIFVPMISAHISITYKNMLSDVWPTFTYLIRLPCSKCTEALVSESFSVKKIPIKIIHMHVLSLSFFLPLSVNMSHTYNGSGRKRIVASVLEMKDSFDS